MRTPITLGLVLLGWLLTGWSLSLLWAWFVVPVFALPAISIWQAAGLSMVVKTFTYVVPRGEQDPEGDKAHWERVVASLLFPVLALGFGWVLKTVFL